MTKAVATKYKWLFGLLVLTVIQQAAVCQQAISYGKEIDKVLVKAGRNRSELEKALYYFNKKQDPLQFKAVCFLIGNMDIHYSSSYYWADSLNNKVAFNELNYSDFATALQDFDRIKKLHRGLHPVSVRYRDIDSIKAVFIIDNVERAFEVWKRPWARTLSFEEFCEYLLPYRASIEPLQDWRKTYQQRFNWVQDSAKGKQVQETLTCLANNIKKWFTNTYEMESRKEPLPRLGPMQLLMRKKGPCEDIADLTVFTLRSQGFPVTNDMVTYWATSSGSHFFNSTLDNEHKQLRFDVSSSSVRFTTFTREPAKVIRVTYAKQRDVVAGFEAVDNIPDGFMRTYNYKDVTPEYWPTIAITCQLQQAAPNRKVAFAAVLNALEWRPTWWGKVTGNTVQFSDMCTGAVYLPMYCIQGKNVPCGYPVAVNKSKQSLTLKPDLQRVRDIVIKEQDNYLFYRAGKKYKLFYWDNKWKLAGMQTAQEGTHEMTFTKVPRNALLLLVPEYTQRKERPFTINDAGERAWW
ncbi:MULTISPECIES: transglutaminase domain-containing protein [Niastella]|uniref:Transglutaminase-like domain-containing protein n=1 Tax=Niastella soli TaxID=2821487 RepID=A0ABS3Z5G1_9BACT|nr:hypothetical protein [Niastella soli]MBO9205402.1 hypothetical protein [Niastella soli]